MTQTADFGARIRRGDCLWSAGAHDVLSAMLAQEAGFDAVLTSGFGISASMLGKPDVELYTMTENLSVLRNVAAALTIPVVADADTGYGNAINVMRTVREFEQAGASALIIEDQAVPKRCPAIASRLELISIDEGVSKIRAAVAARRNPNLLIVARTDADTKAESIARACAYADAGADMIQPISAGYKDLSDLHDLRRACGRPLSLQVMRWLETDLSREDLAGIAGIAHFPLVGLLTMTQALRQNYAALRAACGTMDGLPLPMMPLAEFKQFIGYPEIERLQAEFMADLAAE